ncbi:MAG: STAS domain-containing protein [Coriobacteriales bacterium]|jgi:anti-anti-sigma factor|nr:STAS domain-containing protein [Coriobacteriales bacterium]
MDIGIEQNGDTAVVRLVGRLDTNTAPCLQEKIPEVFAENKQVEMNCAQLAYVSSAGLRVLLLAYRTAQKTGARLTFAQVSEEVMEVLRMTGFAEFLEFV